MSYIYEPEIEEEDEGYSIPKILVAVLLLVVIGAGAYIYYQQKRITNSIAYLLNAKKQVEQDLNEMIEKYNLAIEDNDFLADELRAERDRIIRYRDSIKNVSGEDFTRITKYEQQIKSLKESSAIVFNESAPLVPPSSLDQNATISAEDQAQADLAEETKKEETKQKEQIKEKPKKQENTRNQTQPQRPVTEKVVTPEAEVTPNETISEPEKTEDVAAVEKEKPKEVVTTPVPAKKTEEYTNFVRVETPPTYPGCKGNASEKKACFTKKVKSHVGKKFNTDIIDDFNINSGKKRIWVSFDVDKYGNVINVNARTPSGISNTASKALKKEAERVVKSLPKMTAARQNGSPVKINYSVPITFIVP